MVDRLEDHCNIISGYAFKSKDLQDEADIPVIKIGNISNGEDVIIDDKTQYVDEDFLSINDKYHVKKGDILISLTGSHINQPNSMVGRICRNYSDTEYLLNQRAGKVIVKSNTDSNYLYYFFMLNATKESIVTRAYGAANQVNISPTTIEKMKWDFPDYSKQREIGNILSTYDLLIINNNKRIKILEQIAENLYKEWFVRFRFPGHEEVEFEGGAPKDWKIVRLCDIADILMGQSPQSEFYNDNCEGLPFHQGVGSYGDFYLVDGTYSTEGKKIAEPNSIIFSVRAPVGRININLTRIILGRGVAAINSKQGKNGYLLWMLKNMFSKEDIIGNGSVFTSVTKEELYKQKILIPSDELIDRFDSIACDFEKQIRRITLENNNLIKQKDLLLPRLMSGKLEVK